MIIYVYRYTGDTYLGRQASCIFSYLRLPGRDPRATSRQQESKMEKLLGVGRAGEETQREAKSRLHVI